MIAKLFPLPAVGAREHFLTRVCFAFALMAFFPWSMHETLQPKPVGLAHILDLTWLAVPANFALLKGSVCALLVCYGAGLALPVTLPLLAVLQLLPYTLLNSQGHPHHGYQVLSLPLCALAILSLFRWKSTGLSRSHALRVVPALLLGYSWHCWLKSGMRDTLATAVVSAMGGAASWIMVLLELSAFALLCWLPTFRLREGIKNEFAAWHLFLAQWMVGATYFVSVLSKLRESHGGWFARSHYIVLDMVKATRQSYYSALDPALKVDPPLIHFFMEHQNLTRLFFSTGVILEAVIIFTTGSRWLALLAGISMIGMHRGIEALMTLTFYTNEAMLLIFFVNMPYWFRSRKSLLPPA